MANDLKLAVQIFSRTREETFPTLTNQSMIAQSFKQGSSNAKNGSVIIKRTFAEVDDPDQIPDETDQQIKAFNYGKQLVLVSKEQEGTLKYKAKKEEEDYGKVKLESNDYEKQFKLLGFTEDSKVPRHHFMAGVDIILPVRGPKNKRAFAAIVGAMIEGHKVLIAKIIERKNADPKLVVLYPQI